MNKTHRIVWSAVRQAYVVTHEHATTHGKPASTRAAAVLVAGLLAAAPALAGTTTCTDLAGAAKVTLNDGQCATLAKGSNLVVADSVAIGMAAATPSFTGIRLDNAGNIKGVGAAIEITTNTLDSLQNSGTITGTGRGVRAGDGGRIGKIENKAGTIKGEGGHGIEVNNGTLGQASALETGSFIAFLNEKDAEVISGRGSDDSSALRITNGATVNGNIVNRGAMSGDVYGIYIDNSMVNGDISNELGATISAGGADGISLYGVNVAGGVSNAGTVRVESDYDAGIRVGERTTVDGDVDNSGTIDSNGYGIYIWSEEPVEIKGDLKNSKDIVAKKDGINISFASIDGLVKNSGNIKSTDLTDNNLSGLSLEGATVGGILNEKNALIQGNDGINLSNVTFVGAQGMLNQGTIKALDDAINTSSTTLPTLKNEGVIEAADDGLDLDGVIVTTVVNSGSIIVRNDFAIDGVETGEPEKSNGFEIDDSSITKILNSGKVKAGNYGIYIGDSSIVGDIEISGSIEAEKDALHLSGNSTVTHLILAGTDATHLAEVKGKQFALYAEGESLPVRSSSAPRGFGNISLMGHAYIAGDIFTQASTLTVTGANNRINGALDVNSLTVAEGGELVLESLKSTSAGSTGLPSLENALKTSGGSSGGVFNNGRLVLAKADSYQIIGDYSQAAGATLVVRATSDTAYSQLKVLETAKLASGTKIAVDVRQDSEIAAGATSSNTLFTTNRLAGVVQAGALEGGDAFTVSDNSALFDFGAEKTGNNVDLVLKKSANIEQVVKDNKGVVPLASQDAARVLDQIVEKGTGAMAPVITALGKLGSETELAQAVEQLTPALPSAALSAVSDSLGAINRVVQARVEGNIGLSSGDEPSAERYVWVKPFGSYAKQDARSETAGFKANTGGLVFGADAALSPKLRLGAALAYAHSDVDGQSAAAPQSSKVDVYQLIGYGSVQLDGNTEFNFQLDAGRNRNQGERRLPFMGLTASSDYDSLSYHLGAGIGRTFALPRAISSTPSLRVDYTRIKEDGYSETGAGAAGLINGKRAVEQTLLAVDNRVTLPLNERQSVALNAGAAYDLMDDGATLTSAFAGEPGAVFSTAAAGQSRCLWRAGLGYTYKADTGKGGLELTTRLDGEWRKGGYSNATASVKARYAF